MTTYLTQKFASIAPEAWQSLSYEYDLEDALRRVENLPASVGRVLALDNEDDVIGVVALAHSGQIFYPHSVSQERVEP